MSETKTVTLNTGIERMMVRCLLTTSINYNEVK